ncbi:MAG TPA: phosphate ABC transporter permease PstA [Pseudonocardiaceae bacterium]|jgi:phosphate transport system permease protein|nr:phosphate ABC transporter permease PstA [Pseudonocardiaceae bacterium]
MTTTLDAPKRVTTTRRRFRPRAVTADTVCALLGSAAGALGLTWLLYEAVLPLSGVLGFWLVAYVLFLGFYALVTAMTVGGRQAVVDRLVLVLLTSAALVVLAIIGNQIGYTIYRGWPALAHLGTFVTQTMALAGPLDPLTVGGILHAAVGSLEQMGIATAISVPLGVLAALFLAEVGGPGARIVRAIVEAMTALPEIIAGLFIYAMVILTFGLRQSGFAAALALTVMMIPFVTRSAEVMLRLVPGALREASLALGASQWRTAWLVVLPTARSGLTTAVVLAMARAIGETAPVLITAGFTQFLNANPFDGPQTSLPLYIYSYVRLPQATEIARAFGAGLMLMFLVLVLFTLARVLGGKEPHAK